MDHIPAVRLLSGLSLSLALFAGYVLPQEKTAPPPDSAQAYYHYLRAMDLAGSGSPAVAEQEFLKSLEYAPRDAGLRLEYARILLQAQNFKAAQEQLDICLAADPSLTGAHRLRASIYQQGLGDDLSGNERKILAEKTIAEYQEVLKTDPDDPEANLQVGKLLFRLGRMDEAEKNLSRFVRKVGSSVEGLYLLTMIQMEKQHFQEALETARLMEASQPDSPQIKLLKADIMERLRRTSDAIQIYRKMVDDGVADPAPYVGYARLLMDERKIDQALEILARARAAGLASPAVADLQGLAYREKMQWDKAIQSFQEAVQGEPGSMEYRYHLALAFSQSGDKHNAIAAFRSLLKESTRSSGTYSEPERNNRIVFLRNLTFLYSEIRNFRKALEVLEELSSFAPDSNDPTSLTEKVELLRNDHQSLKALETADQAIRKFPSHAPLATLRALALADLGKGQAAAEELARAVQAETYTGPVAWRGLASVWMEIGRADRALDALEKGLNRTPDDPSLLFQKGAALEKVQRQDDAEKIFLQLLEKDPSNAEAWNFVGYMLVDSGKALDRGLEYIRKALRFEPSNAAFLDSLGWGLFRKGELHSAVENLQKAARALPDDPTIQHHLGDALSASGRPVEAREAYEKALSSGPTAEERRQIRLKLRKIRKLRPVLKRD